MLSHFTNLFNLSHNLIQDEQITVTKYITRNHKTQDANYTHLSISQHNISLDKWVIVLNVRYIFFSAPFPSPLQ